MGGSEISPVNVDLEIKELHQFFEDWFLGQMDIKDLSRFTTVLDPDFMIIQPSGRIIQRNELINRITKAYGTHTSIKIWVEDLKFVNIGMNIILATYEEWQQVHDNISKRISTAIFRIDPMMPNSCCWLHVHETWIDKHHDNDSST
ncbi:MAG: DUF4440 domain-containing protein [Candidatus Kariarchaeaceae archaeon]|jgi:hypothetical protein